MIVQPELPDHPQYQLLKKVVGEFAMEALVRLWGWCQNNSRGGHWPGKDSTYVETVCRWEGQAGVLFEALVKFGWVEAGSNGVTIHNWDKQNRKLVSARDNGQQGGRPRKQGTENRTITQGKPNDNRNTDSVSGSVSDGLQEGSTGQNGKPNDNPTETQPKPNRNPRQTHPSNPSPLSNPSGGVGELETDDFALARGRIALLNELTGSAFNPPLQDLDQIAGRLLEVNRDVPGVDAMLRRQVALWKHDAKARHWLKPGTLFGENFHDYYGQRHQPVAVQNGAGENRRSQSAATNDRGEGLQQLGVMRSQLEKLPADHADRPALSREVAALETQLQTA